MVYVKTRTKRKYPGVFYIRGSGSESVKEVAHILSRFLRADRVLGLACCRRRSAAGAMAYWLEKFRRDRGSSGIGDRTVSTRLPN